MNASQQQLVLDALESGGRLRGSWWKTNCPFCLERVGKEDRDSCLSVHAKDGGGHCFRCGVRVHVDLPESLRVERSLDSTQEKQRWKVEALEGFVELGSREGMTAKSLEPAWSYLGSRQLSFSSCIDAGVGACAVGNLAKRVVVPVWDETLSEWRGYVSRLWTKDCDKRLKYRNAPGEWRTSCVYNAAALCADTDEFLLVVEGVFDALAHWPHAVALLGDATDAQAGILSRGKRPLVVALDGDAFDKGWSLAERLKLAGARAGSVRLPAGVDPDEVPGDWLYEEARRALA
jgi:Toprim domain-containing protein